MIGQAGLLDLGYIAFYAIGAYWTALLSTHFGVSFWILLPTSAVLAALFGVVLGYPTLRLRGDYLAIVTLGFGEIIRITLNNWRELTNGPMGIMNVPHPTIAVPGVGVLEFGLKVQAYYFFVLALAAMTVFVVRRLVHSRIGLAWKAIREDELAAGAMGVDVRRAKLLAFGLGARVRRPGRELLRRAGPASSPRRASPSPSRCWSSASSSSAAPGSLAGVILGALVFIALPELLREAARYRMLAFGVAMVTLALVRPQGLLGRTWVGEERDEDRAPEGDVGPGAPVPRLAGRDHERSPGRPPAHRPLRRPDGR